MTSLRQTHLDALHALFRAPPALAAVALQCAQAYLDTHLRAWKLSAQLIYLASPTGPYQSLPELLVQRLAQARPMLLVEGYHQVMRRTREVYLPGAPTLAELETLINQCGTQLLDAYGQRLHAWWHEPVAGHVSRWAGLSDGLLGLLHDAPAPPGLSQDEWDRWFPQNLLKRRRPDPYWSMHGPARVQAVYLRHEGQADVQALMAPLLVITHRAPTGAEQSLLFRPASGVQVLQRLDDAEPWLQACDAAQNQWFVAEVQGDPFDNLAAAYLACQLRDIDSIECTLARTPQQILDMLDAITDARRWFVERLSPLQQHLRNSLPLWLAQAGAADSLACARLLQDWLQLRQQQGAVHFMDGIAPLQAFAVERLRTCLGREPKAAALSAQAISLTFNRVIAAAVPVPGGFIAGEVEPITLTLPELALENLVGFPHTPKAITLNGKPAPEWLSYDLLKGCVTQVDIGQAYPALLKKNLLDDVGEAARRRQLFGAQWRIQLPMLALEMKLRGALSLMGFQRVQAAVKGQAMALWPLAFKASATADADRVATMFVIGPRDSGFGPHLLYQPLSSTALQEFPTLAALLEAICIPGPLQDDVLAWIAPARQSVYAKGGLREPHIRHFLPTDEFTHYEKPAPATLAKILSDAPPAHQVFAAVAEALVGLADRQTLSNAELRWARLKQAGWLLFSSLLPYARGPLMLGGWLLQVLDSAQQDMAGLASDDLGVESAALVDLLVNLVAILAHQAAPHDPRGELPWPHPVFKPVLQTAPIARPRVQLPTPAHFTAPAGWANARDVLTHELQLRLRALSLKTLPGSQLSKRTSGRWQGLLRDARHTPAQWQAQVRGEYYRVRIDRGRARVISPDGRTDGPWLKPVGQGVWDVDLQLRLLGGGDRQTDRRADDYVKLEEAHEKATHERDRASHSMEKARSLLDKKNTTLDERQRNQIQGSYRQAMADKVSALEQQLQALRRLRALKPRPRYEEDVCEVLENLILTTQLLDTQMRHQMAALNANVRPLLDGLAQETAEEARTPANRQAHRELHEGMRALAAVHARAIHWRGLEARYLDALFHVPRLGRDRARAVSAGMHARPSVLDLQSLQLTTLWGIAIDIEAPLLDEDFFASMGDTLDRARWASRSLADLDSLNTTAAERIELLESIDHVYTQTDDQIEFWRTFEPDKFNVDYLQKLQELLASMHQHAQGLIAQVLQPEDEPMPVPRSEGQRRKKIIRTRNRDILVAELSEPDPAASAETARMHDDKGNLLASFTEGEDGVWDLSRSPSPRPDPGLGSLLKQAERALKDVDRAIASVETMVERANDPASLQELLEAQGRSREWLADAVRNKLRSLDHARLSAPQQAQAQAVESQLRAAVFRLDAAGLDARVRATRRRTLSQDDVAFLHRQREIRIVREGPRVKLAGSRDDFLQEYRVLDVHTGKALCFAHFHYARQVSPDDHFTAAHLKTPEQRRLGQQAQAEVQAAAFARMRLGQTGRAQQTLEIHRAQIQLPLARRLFFSVD